MGKGGRRQPPGHAFHLTHRAAWRTARRPVHGSASKSAHCQRARCTALSRGNSVRGGAACRGEGRNLCARCLCRNGHCGAGQICRGRFEGRAKHHHNADSGAQDRIFDRDLSGACGRGVYLRRKDFLLSLCGRDSGLVCADSADCCFWRGDGALSRHNANRTNVYRRRCKRHLGQLYPLYRRGRCRRGRHYQSGEIPSADNLDFWRCDEGVKGQQHGGGKLRQSAPPST